MRQVLRNVTPATVHGYVKVYLNRNPPSSLMPRTPTTGPRRPRSPERQGPPRRPEYDYFHDIDYLDYIDSR